MTAKAGLLAQTAFSRAHRRLCGMLALEDYRAMGPAFDGRVQVAANLEGAERKFVFHIVKFEHTRKLKRINCEGRAEAA